MPSEKRARQRAGRQARLAALAQQQKRRSVRNRVVVFGILAVVIGGIAAAVATSSSSPPKAAKGTTTTTRAKPATGSTLPSTTTTTVWPVAAATRVTAPPTPSVDVSKYTNSTDCPSNFHATLKKPSWSTPPTDTINKTKTYTATIVTDVGTIVVELDPESAPANVNNFVFLAENHFYDCVIFHRVITTFMDQTGDPTGTGQGSPGYKLPENEYPPTATPQYPIGSVAMANSGPGSNGSQFFIVTGTHGETLPPQYTILGKVIAGLPVADKINDDGAVWPGGSMGTPVKFHRMISVTISES